MAVAAREKFGADYGIGITGLADTSPDDSGVAPGTVYVAISNAENTRCVELRQSPDRRRVRVFASSTALDLIRRELTQ
jgi:nicotinamide-nucleotide amidase